MYQRVTLCVGGSSQSHEVVGKRDVPLAVTEHRLGEITCERSVYPADVKGSAQSCGRWSPSCRWITICRWSRLLLVRELVWITVLEQGYELATAAVEAAKVERLKRAEVAHCDEKGSGEATLAAHRGQYPSVCASQAREEVLRNATSALKDEQLMIACRPTTGLKTWGVPGAHPARTAWSNGQG